MNRVLECVVMVSAFDAGLSGLQRAERGASAAAGNIANLNTDGYRALGAGGRPRHSDAAFAAADADAYRTSDVDLAEELIALERESVAYRASATVIRHADRQLGTLLDIFA